jgi:hypothetical protein
VQAVLKVGEVFSGPRVPSMLLVNLTPGFRGGKYVLPTALVKDQWALLFLRNEAGRWVAPPVGRVIETPYAFEVGDKNPAGDAYYVHVKKDDGLYTVSSWKVDEWKKWATNPPLAALPSPTPKPSPVASPSPAPKASAPAASPAAPSPAASK